MDGWYFYSSKSAHPSLVCSLPQGNLSKEVGNFSCSALEHNAFFLEAKSFSGLLGGESSLHVPHMTHADTALSDFIARSGLKGLVVLPGKCPPSLFCCGLLIPTVILFTQHTLPLSSVVFCSCHVTCSAVHSPQTVCGGFLLLSSPQGILSGYITE